MHKKDEKLKRYLGLFSVTLAGTGIILGAGIYALIGIGANLAGNAVWLSFLIASLVAVFTGLSYAELSSMFRVDAGEYDYVQKVFNKRLAFFIGLMIIFTGIVSAATVALGFGGYIDSLISLSVVKWAIILTILMLVINYIGIRETAFFNNFSGIIELIGLILIIALGVKYFGRVDYFEMPNGFTGVLRASALVFFAYMGFETIVKLSEETKKPEKTIPKAIILSVVIATILYILTSLSAISILGWRELGSTSSPLAKVAEVSFGRIAFFVLTVIALFSTSNTVLMTNVTTSRLVYGMAEEKSLPRFLSKVHEKHRTPYVAAFVLAFFSIIFIFIGDIEFVANLNNIFLFLTFTFINLSVIVLRYKYTDIKRPFRVPFSIGRFPVLALFGMLTSIFLLTFTISNII
ncbi:amino acid permease [Candidatus Woesearchaeota archaeon]|nr:amino acid permease [Candidatus Woesearchaeota archaeon]